MGFEGNMKKIDLQQAISIAYKYYQSKQYSQVKHILQPLIQHGVQSIDIYYFMAAAHYCLDEYEQAVEAYHGMTFGNTFLHSIMIEQAS